MGVYIMGVYVAGMVGPALGGWLTDTYGWPWIFYINVPVGIVGISAGLLRCSPIHPTSVAPWSLLMWEVFFFSP